MPHTLGGSPAVLLTPGRTRNIAQDMEALRLSRQDNPYLQVKLLRLIIIKEHTYITMLNNVCLCNHSSK